MPEAARPELMASLMSKSRNGTANAAPVSSSEV
jgi:hypothetical protein